MTLDRKQLVCYVVGAKIDEEQWRWCALNEDGDWLIALDAERAEQAEKVGVFCCKANEDIRAAALEGLGVSHPQETVAYRMFQSSDSDEAAAVLSRKVLHD